ncbi:MAG: magnesium transporter, partial [Sphingopyxis terrae]
MDKREDSLPPEDVLTADGLDHDPGHPPRETETELDEDDRLKPAFVRDVIDLAEEGEVEAARERVGRLHPADIADLFELVSDEDRPLLAQVLGDLLSPDVLAEMNDYVRERLIDLLAPEQVAEIASELDTDDAVAIIEDMEEDEQQAVLRAMEPEDRAAIEDALSFPEESAGRLMQREFVAVPEHVTVGDVIDRLREDVDLATDFWEIFVVDPMHRPVGTCQLSWILRAPRSVAINDI